MSSYDPDSLFVQNETDGPATKRQRTDGAEPAYVQKFAAKGSFHWWSAQSDNPEGRLSYVREECMPAARSLLSRMRLRSGSYAITCAFLDELLVTSNRSSPFTQSFLSSFRGASTAEEILDVLDRWPSHVGLAMTKDEIIRSGQKYADSKMEADAEEGRMFGAWAAMSNLAEKKNFFLRGRRGQQHEFSVSVVGVVYLIMFFRKHPEYVDTQKEFIDADEEYELDLDREQEFLMRLQKFAEEKQRRRAATKKEGDDLELAAGDSEAPLLTSEEIFFLLPRSGQQRILILRKMLELRRKPAEKMFRSLIEERTWYQMNGHDFSPTEMNLAIRLDLLAHEGNKLCRDF